MDRLIDGRTGIIEMKAQFLVIFAVFGYAAPRTTDENEHEEDLCFQPTATCFRSSAITSSVVLPSALAS